MACRDFRPADVSPTSLPELPHASNNAPGRVFRRWPFATTQLTPPFCDDWSRDDANSE
jgi:hypothetical protein